MYPLSRGLLEIDDCREIFRCIQEDAHRLRRHITASQAELMAARKRSLRAQSEAEDIPSKVSFVGERVEHADAIKDELQDARRCLQARFEDIEK